MLDEQNAQPVMRHVFYVCVACCDYWIPNILDVLDGIFADIGSLGGPLHLRDPGDNQLAIRTAPEQYTTYPTVSPQP